jgi:hypothetical protein
MEPINSLPCSKELFIVPILRHINPVHITTSFSPKSSYLHSGVRKTYTYPLLPMHAPPPLIAGNRNVPHVKQLYLCELMQTFQIFIQIEPITVAAGSKARTIFARSNTGVMDSNPTRSMDVCLRLICDCVFLCVGRGLATG